MTDGPASLPGARETPGVRVWRGERIESLHAVHAAIADAGGDVVSVHGSPDRRAYMRSSAKPIQLLPLVEEGLVERYGFTDEEIAVMAASHGGQPFHLWAVRSVLEKADLDPGLLLCGAHPPLDPEAARALREAGEEPDRLHNNCSGKHAGMLAVCRAMGWPVGSYLEFDHPLQARIHRTVAELAGVPVAAVHRAVDGCGAPTFLLAVREMAGAFGRLAAADRSRGDDRSRAVGRILDAMAAHPEMVAGTGRLDSDLLSVTGGSVVAKTGAEGVFCAVLRERGEGLALKVGDGAKRAQDVALVELLRRAGVLDRNSVRRLERHGRPEVLNHAGLAVGWIDALLPLGPPV